MGIYVQIQKKSSANGVSNYMFSNEFGSGEFSINEKTGALDYYKKMPNDPRKLFFSRAAYKIVKSWEKNGKLPDSEVWSS